MKSNKTNIKFYLDIKYLNYKILSNKIYDFKEFEIGIDNHCFDKKDYDLYLFFLDIKRNILNSNKMHWEEKIDLKEFLNSMINILKLSKSVANDKILVEKNRIPLHEAIQNGIINTANKLEKGRIDIDEILSCYRLVDFSLSLNKDNMHMIGSYRTNVISDMSLLIYGIDLENLNRKWLSNELNTEIKKTPDIIQWNSENYKNMYEYYCKTKGFVTLQDFDSPKVPDRYKGCIPTFDAKTADNKYFEIKNYTEKHGITFHSTYTLNKQIQRFQSMVRFEKMGNEIMYNINIYHKNSEELDSYIIPMQDIYKLYKKIDSKLNSYFYSVMKSNSKESLDLKTGKDYSIELEIDNNKIICKGNLLKYRVDGKEIVQLDGKTNVVFNSFDTFDNFFNKFKVKESPNHENVLTRNN